jgi:hypothetical protein
MLLGGAVVEAAVCCLQLEDREFFDVGRRKQPDGLIGVGMNTSRMLMQHAARLPIDCCFTVVNMCHAQ